MSDALTDLARRAGILPRYQDQMDDWRETAPATRAALLAAMGLSAESEAEARDRLATLPRHDWLPAWHVAEADSAPDLPVPDAWRLTLQDGTESSGRGALPALPLGRHRLDCAGETCWILSAPRRLPLPERGWGLMVPLPGLRPEGRGGLGDYAELARMAEGAAGHGARFLGINPVHAGFPADAAGFSPYSPSHRRRLNILHVAAGAEPPADGALIDYPAARAAQMAALETRFAAERDDPRLAAWRRAEGAALRSFALHQALSERHGAYWSGWPAALRDPQSVETRRAAEELADRVAFHEWAQWRAETDLRAANDRARAAGMRHGLYLDLAVGTHPHGAETWEDRASFAFGASLGAPPDAFSKDGQRWNLAPFNPLHLAATGFAALAETLGRQLDLAGLLRIDHILGFERAFWVPEDGPGAYVQMPREAMLAVARIEAARRDATIVGEDLGNLPEELPPALGAAGVLGCRLAMFEQDWEAESAAFTRPEDYTEAAVASFSTHDLPTWRGWRAGGEIAERARLGQIGPEQQREAQAARAVEVAAFDHASAPYSDAAPDSAERMHAFLAAAGSRLVAVQVENVLDLAEQPNLPGTVDEHPNWRRRLPKGPEQIAADPRLARTADIMQRQGR
ncbi:4-alpha-glucanotransferase [Roseivivax sp. CAU 1761]